MSSFVKKVEELTHDQRTTLEKVGFGYLIRIHHHTLRKNLLVEFEWMERRLQSLGELHNEDFVRTFLFIFGTLFFPSSSAKVDSRYLSLLKDLDRVCEYAWGVAVVEDLFNWLSKRKEEQTKSIEGCLILLQVTWKLQPTTAELNIDIIRELLVEELEGKVKHSMRTNTTTSSITPKDFKDGILYEEINGGVGLCKLNPQSEVVQRLHQWLALVQFQGLLDIRSSLHKQTLLKSEFEHCFRSSDS
uniref:Aminotransferase-like plant mobile domain-containing protein n=1 Tax=Amaranthus palmeri TaxID=107608 RepID=A0A6C0T6L9_AMAPA|nr:hypothetical protein AP_R.00g000030-v1.0.a3 [Amaranthus palmeri]